MPQRKFAAKQPKKPVNSIGSLYCPVIVPDTSNLEKEFLEAMNTPIDELKITGWICGTAARGLAQMRDEDDKNVRREPSD